MNDRKIFFGRSTQIFYELSPYHARSFTCAGRTYKTLIHYWLSTLYPNTGMKDMISSVWDVQKVIKLCNKQGFKDFNQVNPKEIVNGIQLLLTQHEDIKNILLSTGARTLVYDGLGYLAEDNRYGQLLMKIREIIEKNDIK